MLAKTTRDTTTLSKLLSLVLRHDPTSIGITLDPNGWTEVEALFEALARHGQPLTRVELEQLVRDSDKQRFAFSPEGTRIRANQGHSVEVALGYCTQTPPEVLFHGTLERLLPSIHEHGLLKGKRHHVHLSATRELAQIVARRRRGLAVVLEIAAGAMARDGLDLFRSDNGVWLVSHVPPHFIRTD